MRERNKRPLALALGLSIAATSLSGAFPACAAKIPQTAAESAAHEHGELPGELFSSLTVNSDGELIADGNVTDGSFGGVTIDENAKLTFADGDQTYDLAQACNVLGVEVGENKLGEQVILSPFSTARLIVRSDEDFDCCGAEAVTEEFEGLYLLEYPTIADAYAAFQLLSADASITYVEPDSVCSISYDDEMPMPDDDPDVRITAWDLGGWGVEAIGARDFCERLKEEKEELPEIVVAVIDTGVRSTHQAFEGRIAEGGKSFVDGADSSEDDHYHGTHCAGIICSATNENVKILPIKVLDEYGAGSIMNIYSGMRYAVEQGADVISMSLGGEGRSNLFDEAVALAREKDIPVCVASGNEYFEDNMDFATSLSSIEYCVTVGSVGSALEHSEFSNCGMVDFAAPGEEIKSAYTSSDNGICWLSGTSMATPFAAACFADIYSYDPELTQAEVYDYLKANALDIGEEGFDDENGWGLVNLRNFHFDDTVIPSTKSEPKPGRFSEPFTMTLSAAGDCDGIYYTLDGSLPNMENGIPYSGEPIEINGTTIVKAAAFVGGIPGRYEVFKYNFGNDGVLNDCIEINESTHSLSIYRGDFKVLDLADLVEQGELPEFKYISPYAFQNCDTLEEVIIPPYMEELPPFGFSECRSLKKVTTSASRLNDYVFENCLMLEEIVDDNITEIGKYAFANCYQLKKIDCTKLENIPDNAFERAGSITADSFDFTKIKTIGMRAFSGSGIKGDLDLTNVNNIDYMAFANTSITSIKLPESLEEIDCLAGCADLKYISAPGASMIGTYGMPLGKTSFEPETVVKFEGDMANIRCIFEHGLDGYVFDGDISFDSVDYGGYINGLQFAYGRRASFPNVSDPRISSLIGMDYSESYVDVIDVPNADCFDIWGKLSDFGAIVSKVHEQNMTDDEISNFDEVDDNEIPRDIIKSPLYIYTDGTLRWADKISADFDNVFLKSLPGIYCREDNITLRTGQCRYISAYALGDGVHGAWFEKTADGVSAVDVPGDASVAHYADRDGSKTYIYRLYSDNGEFLDEKEITVTVEDEVRIPIEVNCYEDLKREDNVFSTEAADIYAYSFTPEKTDTYVIKNNLARVEIRCDGELIFSSAPFGFQTKCVDLEAGRTYNIDVIKKRVGIDYLNNESQYPPYFALRSHDDTKLCLSDLQSPIMLKTAGRLGEDDFEFEYILHGYPFSERDLIRDVDFELVFDEELHYGNNHYTARGIGDYYGVSADDDLYIAAPMELDVWYDYESDGLGSFSLSEDKEVSVLVKPEWDDVVKIADEGSYFTFYSGYVALYIDESWGATKTNGYNIGGYDYDEERYKSFVCEKDIAMLRTVLYSRYYYSIVPGMERTMFMLTESDNTLFDCKLEYTKNYKYTGEAVIPEITLTNSKGEILEEGVDYRMILIRNTEPGLMQAYIEGGKNYPGFLCLTMAIEGGGFTVDDDGYPVIEPGQDVELYEGFDYKLKVEEPSIVTMENDGIDRYCKKTFFRDRDGNMSQNYESFKERLSFPAGKYTIWTSPSEHTSSDHLKSVTYRFKLEQAVFKELDDCEITLEIPDAGSGLYAKAVVSYNGEVISKFNYHTFFEKADGLTNVFVSHIVGCEELIGERYIYYITPPASDDEVPVIKDGTNRMTAVSDPLKSVYRWKAEGDYCTISSDSYENVTVAVAEKDGTVLAYNGVGSWNICQCDVEKGKEYYILVSNSRDMEADINISSKLTPIGKCELVSIGDLDYEKKASDVDIVLKDGDHILEQGIDFRFVEATGNIGLGPCEVVVEGMGNYVGREKYLTHVYRPQLAESTKFNKILEGETFEIHSYIVISIFEAYLIPGWKCYYSFTSEHPGVSRYRLSAVTYDGDPISRSSILFYDESGRFIGSNACAEEITLKQGETVKFIMVTPYVYDEADDYNEIDLYSVIEYIGEGTEEPNIIYGDVNGNGRVDASDASAILREYSILSTGGAAKFTADQQKAADVNEDGYINAADASLILSYYAYLSTGGRIDEIKVWIAGKNK